MPTPVHVRRMIAELSEDGTEWNVCLMAEKLEQFPAPQVACSTIVVEDPTGDAVDDILGAQDWEAV